MTQNSPFGYYWLGPMENDEKQAILEHFGDLEDPHLRPSPHGLMELLLTVISAALSGAHTCAGVAMWGQAKLDWLRQFLPFTNGVASHDTFGRVFAMLDAAMFEQCFIRMDAVCCAFEGLQVALDGNEITPPPQNCRTPYC